LFTGDFLGAGTSSYASRAQEAEVVEAALKEMETEMQLCHGTHHHPEHSNDQGMEKMT
jgi:hypothetical protein